MITKCLSVKLLIVFSVLISSYSCAVKAQNLKFIKQKLPEEIKSINDIKIEGDIVWIATGQGLYKYKNKKIVRYFDESAPEKFMINSIEIDEFNNKWLSNYAGNLLKFNDGKIIKEIDFIGLLDNRSDLLTDIEINKEKSTKNSEILLTSSNGLILYYNPELDQIGLKSSPVKNMIYSIHYGINDVLWLCTGDGFFSKHDDKNWKNKQDLFYAYGVKKSGDKYWGFGRNKNNEAVFMLYYTSDDNKNSKKYVWKEFDLKNIRNKYSRFYDVEYFNNETVWIASDEGLIRYNPITGNVDTFNKENTKNFELNDVRHLIVQDKKTIWLSSFGASLYKLVLK
ncbi:MAG: hypothetical protein JXR51_10050 [Bacteroidales bacterium]|nr:hypothetical protein [Bacteroidales bacterium]MBN2757508.1 hypothetical protein [Bacteroidales bacterium]